MSFKDQYANNPFDSKKLPAASEEQSNRWQRAATRSDQVRVTKHGPDFKGDCEIVSVEVRIPRALESITDTMASAVSRGTDALKTVVKHMDFVEALPGFIDRLEKLEEGTPKRVVRVAGRDLLFEPEDAEQLISLLSRAEELSKDATGVILTTPAIGNMVPYTDVLPRADYIDIKMAALMGMSVKAFRAARNKIRRNGDDDGGPEQPE